MRKMWISIIGFASIILTLANGCISVRFQNGLITNDSVEIEFETPMDPEMISVTSIPETLAPTGTATKSQPTPTKLASPATPTLGVGSIMTGKDGVTLVYVPAGEFTMGTWAEDALAECQKFTTLCPMQGLVREEPPHEVYLDAFWIDQTEVTNALYAQCVKDEKCEPPSSTKIRSVILGLGGYYYYGNPQFDHHPVIYISWSDAQAYCSWAGRRLPTEAEWEKAARGTDGRIYPWGNEGPNFSLANYTHVVEGYTAAVGKYQADVSPYGVLDMGGNVTEWVADWYSDTYYANSPLSNPTGPEKGDLRITRGGLWLGYSDHVRSTYRNVAYPADESEALGFRCAMNALP